MDLASVSEAMSALGNVPESSASVVVRQTMAETWSSLTDKLFLESLKTLQ